MDWTRPNVFQQLLRSWEQVHPYNAAQVLALEPQAARADWAAAWSAALKHLGLGAIRFQRGRYRFEPPIDAAAIDPPRRIEPAIPLDEFLTGEMNRPFPTTDSMPFRPFLIGTDPCYAGIVYQHWVADSVSIRTLLRQWFLEAIDPAEARKSPAARFAEGGYWHYFGPQHGGWNVFDAFLRSWIWSQDMRRVRQMKIWHSSSHAMHVSLQTAPAGCIDRLREQARHLGATVNDLFLAALFETCDRLMPAQRARRRRNWLVGSIVDLRPYARVDLSDTFGMFLGFSDTVCRPRDMGDWPALLRSVAARTRAQRRPGEMRSTIFRLTGAAAACTILSPAQGAYFCRKHAPLTAGLSNINLANAWPARYHPSPIVDYLRISPTGPMAPMVLAATTLAGRLNISATGRTSIIEPALMDRIVNGFIERLVEAGGGR